MFIITTNKEMIDYIGTSKDVVEVNCPMPGTILDVCVSEGAYVRKGETLCILEALKMENEIASPVDGRIESVFINRGKCLNTGEVMFCIVERVRQ